MLGLTVVAPLFCSVASYATARPSAAIVATTLPDTVLAGPGPIQYAVDRGHVGGPTRRDIYGQRVRIERSIAATVAGSVAILVPWDYAANCRPTPWPRSAAWTAPGTRGVFAGVLRPREQWIDGTPTLDVMRADHQPFPQRFRREEPAAPLTADDYADLLERLPSPEELDSLGTIQYQAVLAWLAAHPEFRGRAPVPSIERHIADLVRRERFDQLEVPIAGTYRVTISGAGAEPLVCYARTMTTAVGEYFADLTATRDGLDPTRPFEGYSLLATGADRLDQLPTERAGTAREGYFNALLATAVESDGSRVARGQIDRHFLALQFPSDTLLARLGREERGLSAPRPRNQATIAIGPAERVVIEERIDVGGGRSLVVRAERISTETLR